MSHKKQNDEKRSKVFNPQFKQMQEVFPIL